MSRSEPSPRRGPVDATDPHSYLPLSPTDFHLLMVLAEDDLYGYAMMKEVEEQSGGALTPEIGSLYRMIGRLVSAGLVEDMGNRVPDKESDPQGRGRPRRYYRITKLGREILMAEAARLREVLGLAAAKKLLPEGAGS
jgi:DNA-binding PadR family transcriptional regulator